MNECTRASPSPLPPHRPLLTYAIPPPSPPPHFHLDQTTPPLAAAVIQALTHVIRTTTTNTMMGLEVELKAATDQLAEVATNNVQVQAAGELFNRYVTRTALDIPDFTVCKSKLIERGELFLETARRSRELIAAQACTFIRDGLVILVHGFSKVVLTALVGAANKGLRFRVIVTESRPDQSGYGAASVLQRAGMPVELVLDAGVGAVIERVDLVLVGAEGVVENGGIINRVGTFSIALAAKSHSRPFYVAVESYKFCRQFPLRQADLPSTNTDRFDLVETPSAGAKAGPPALDTTSPLLRVSTPIVDVTPPQYITLLFTDLGILTPSAISDELIKLYY